MRRVSHPAEVRANPFVTIMSDVASNLQRVHQRIERAALAADQSACDIRLLAVSKTQPARALRDAHAAGQRAFGENYLQEALQKIAALADLDLEWHFIGPIQSNKTREIARHFHWVHSIDREKVARRLSEQRPPELGPLDVCIQVNTSGEASKSGVSPDRAAALAQTVAALPGLRLRGLMTIPAPAQTPASQQAPFRSLRQLQERLIQQGLPLDTLSMGMSSDLEAAIAEGSTLVRVGTAIFGARPAPKP